MKTFVITSDLGERRWQADDADHAREQHLDAFPDEPVLAIRDEIMPARTSQTGDPSTMSKIQKQTVESILATVDGTVFRSDTGEVIIMLHADNYAISVDEDGSTASAYLVTVPPTEIAAAMDADRAEISGWSTGWEC